MLKLWKGGEASPYKVDFEVGGSWKEWKEKGKEMGRMIVKDLRRKEDMSLRWGGRGLARSFVMEWATEVVVEVTRWQMEKSRYMMSLPLSEQKGPGKGVRSELEWVRERVEEEEAEEEAGKAK